MGGSVCSPECPTRLGAARGAAVSREAWAAPPRLAAAAAAEEEEEEEVKEQ